MKEKIEKFLKILEKIRGNKIILRGKSGNFELVEENYNNIICYKTGTEMNYLINYIINNEFLILYYSKILFDD